MILSDGEIKEALTRGLITIDPPPTEEQYNTSSLDLLLGDELREFLTPAELDAGGIRGVERPLIVKADTIDIKALVRDNSRPARLESDGSYILHRNAFILGITQEFIDLKAESKLAARVEGRSSLARLGLLVHFTAPTVHAGFRGRIVLEMCNLGPYPIKLFPAKLPVCQLVFERLGKRPLRGLTSVHQDQRGFRK